MATLVSYHYPLYVNISKLLDIPVDGYLINCHGNTRGLFL